MNYFLPKSLALVLAVLWSVLFYSLQAQTTVIDSLVALYEQSDSVEQKVNLATDLAWEYLYLDPEKTDQYAREALKIAEEANYEFGIASAWGSVGLYCDVTGDYDGAINAYLNAIRILEKDSTYAYNVSVNQHNLSLIFNNIGDWEKAILYAKKALEFDLANDKFQGQVFVYMNIGTMFGSADMLDSSLYYHHKAVSVGKAHDVPEHKVTYVNLSDIEIQRENFDSALFYLSEYMQFARTNKSSRKLNRLAHGYLSFSQLYLKLKEVSKSKLYIDSSQTLVHQLQSPRLMVSVLENYSEYYGLKSDFKNALKYFQKKQSLQDSITKMELREKIEISEARYQREKQTNEINQLKASNDIQELQIAKTKSQNLLFLVAMVLSLVMLGILFYLFVNSRRNSKRLKAKNKIIENLIRESHHRIKNNLQVVSSLLNMQAKTVNSKEAQKAITDAHHRVKTIALLHQRLQGAKDFDTIDLNDFLKNLSNNIVSGMASTDLQVESKFDLQKTIVKTDKAIAIGLLLNELITNSIKYASTLGQPLKLLLKLEEGKNLKLLYSDNGPGLPKDFEPTESRSLGFTIINSLINQLNGGLDINSQNGFKAEIVIPYEQ